MYYHTNYNDWNLKLNSSFTAASRVSFYEVSVESFQCFSTWVKFSRRTRTFVSFTIEMIENKTTPLLTVALSRKCINRSETYTPGNVVRGSKTLCKWNPYEDLWSWLARSVNCQQTSNCFRLFYTFHPAGTVLPLSSAVCNITPIIGDSVHKCAGG